MRVLIWTWLISAAIAFVAVLLASLRMRYWWRNKTMRTLLVFFVGVAIYAGISFYLSGRALGGVREQLDRPLSDPALLGTELLTIGQLCMLIPATLLAVQMYGMFERPQAGDLP